MKLLLVEDALPLQRAIAKGLRQAGFAVDATADGAEGLWLAQSNAYDAIILDLMLPNLDGLSVVKRLRDAGQKTHILLLTAKDTVPDRVRGLQMGADDYLVKPFAFEELLARVQALCRRSYGRKESRITVADLELDLTERTVRRAGQPVRLQPREFALLEYLALRHGEVVSRRDIETHLYNDAVDPMSNVVDSAICALRRKLAVNGCAQVIHTRHGHGYVLGEKPA
jgi:DNA-binding response OmpR family regulator